MKVGILVHGRHLQAVGWERLVWGDPPHKLGSLPMAVLTILNRGQENVKAVVFGTGASERGGLKEAEYTKKFLLEALRHQNLLQKFTVIKAHPRLQSTRDIVALSSILADVFCEIESQNTIEEISNASKFFATRGIQEVIQVTCASHAPRCVLNAGIAEEQGLIPRDQFWTLVHDHMTYEGTSMRDVLVIEPPHRGDDPMLNESLQAHQVLSAFYKIKGKEKKVEALGEIQRLISTRID